MLNKEKMFELLDKVSNDCDYLENTHWLEMTKKQLIDDAQEIYHAQNFYWNIEYIVENYDDEDDATWLTEETIDKIINFKGNIVEYWVNHRYDYRHSERYNLEGMEDFTNAVEIVIGNIGE